MQCPLCSAFNGINAFFMGLHLRQNHELHSSHEVLAKAMFLNSVGHSEAMMVFKDFEMRDQKYRNAEQYQAKKYDKSAQADMSKNEEEVKVGNKIKFEEYWED